MNLFAVRYMSYWGFLRNHLRLRIPDFDSLKYSHLFPMIWVFICVHVCVKLSSAVDGWVGYSFISQKAVFPPWIFMTFGLF